MPDPGVAGGVRDWGQGRRARKSPGASGWATGQARGAGGVPLAAPSPQHPPSLAETALLLLNPKQSWVCHPHPSQGWVTGMGGRSPRGPWAVFSGRALPPSWGHPGKTQLGDRAGGMQNQPVVPGLGILALGWEQLSQPVFFTGHPSGRAAGSSKPPAEQYFSCPPSLQLQSSPGKIKTLPQRARADF